ncbi:DUF6776 family protein [Colwellia sp. MEBiC06753]
MNWLAKINLSVVVKRLGVFKSALLLFSTIALCLYVGYRLGNYYHGNQLQTIAQQKTRLDNLYQTQNNHLKRIHTLEVELEVERLANKQAQDMIRLMEEKHFAVKKELAFYQKVMAPEKQADGLVIDSVTFQSSESTEHYRFSVVLVQQSIKKRFAQGYIDLTIRGSLAGKPHQVTLNQISDLTKEQLSFSLKFFQAIDGEVTLPEKFVPETVEVKAVLPKGKWQTYHELNQIFNWSEVFTVQE